MPGFILTAETLANHLQIKAQHDHWEKQFHFSRDQLLLALQDTGSFSDGDYGAIIREFERRSFQSKLFALHHPDLHEEYLKISVVQQLVVRGPAVLPALPAVAAPAPRPKRDLKRVIAELMKPDDTLDIS